MAGNIENMQEEEGFNAVPIGDLSKVDNVNYLFSIGIHDLVGKKKIYYN
jgi:hypothetical protein